MSKTQRLRDECKRRRIPYRVGFCTKSTERTNVDTVTELWDGEHASRSLTFEEDEHGSLWCADELSVSQCIGAYLAGAEEDE